MTEGSEAGHIVRFALPLLGGCSLDDAEQYLTDTVQQAFGGEEAETGGGSATGSCTVHFLDVGQGDSELIVTDTAAVLIDAGEQSAADDILADAKALNEKYAAEDAPETIEDAAE